MGKRLRCLDLVQLRTELVQCCRYEHKTGKHFGWLESDPGASVEW